MTMYILTLKSIFVMFKGAKIGTMMHLLTLESIFVMYSGAKNDNVFT